MKKVLIAFLALVGQVACQSSEKPPTSIERIEGEGANLPDVIHTQTQVAMWIDGTPIQEYLDPMPEGVIFDIASDGDSTYYKGGEWAIYKFGPKDFRPSMIMWEGAKGVKLRIGNMEITEDTRMEALADFFPNSYANRARIALPEEGETAFVVDIGTPETGTARLKWYQNKPTEFVFGYPDEGRIDTK